MKIIVLVMAILILFSSPGLQLNTQGDSAAKERNTNYGISIMTDKMSYSIGEPIIMNLKIFNYTEENTTFHFNTAQRYDFIIEDGEGNKIWRWSKDKMFAMVLGEEILGPTNMEVIYTAKYRDKLSPGYYKVTGILVAKDRPMLGNIIIRVK